MPLCVLPLKHVCVCSWKHQTDVTYALSAPSPNFPFWSQQKLLFFHIQNSNKVIKRMHYCDLLRSAAVYTMSAWKAKGGHNESYNFPRSPIKALKWPYSLGWVCDINTICLPLYCSVRGGQCLCDRQRGCRAQPSLDQLSPAQLDPASANPSSPPLNHHAANKGRQQYITGMWQALAIMILKSPLGLWGKAWAHDTLAYRGNNIWKCIVAPDRGEEQGDEVVSRAQAFQRGNGEEMALTVTTSYRLPVWTQANPAFNDGFRYNPLQTSHLTGNLICQHPHFCPIMFSCSWVDMAVSFGHGTCSIQCCQSSTYCVAQRQASSMRTEGTNTVQWAAGLCHHVMLRVTLRNLYLYFPTCTADGCTLVPWNMSSYSQRVGDWSFVGAQGNYKVSTLICVVERVVREMRVEFVWLCLTPGWCVFKENPSHCRTTLNSNLNFLHRN